MRQRTRGLQPNVGPFTTNRSLVPLVLVCAYLFAMPIVMLLIGAFRNAEPGRPAQWSMSAFGTAYLDGETYRTLLNSFGLATAAAIGSTLIAVVLAFLVARTETPLRRLVTPAMVLIVALPPLFYALGWGMLGNPRIGPINQWWQSTTGAEAPLFDAYSWSGLILVSVLKGAAINYLLLLGPFMAMDRSLEEASQISGANRLRTVLRVDLPVLSPAITGVAILSFVVGLEYFDVPLLLGTPVGIRVFSTQIYALITNETPPDYGGASALALLIVVIVVALVIAQWRLLGDRSFATVTGKSHRRDRWDIGKWRWAGTAFIVGYVLLAIVAPLGQLIVGSLQPFFGGDGEYSLVNYRWLLDNPTTMTALRQTLTVAFGAGLIAMVVALLISYAVTHSSSKLRRVLDLLTWLPWAVPGVVLSLGILWMYVSFPGLRSLYSTIWIVLLGLVVAAVPIATRAVQPALAQISRELEEASRVNGASPIRMFFGIVVPLIAPSFVAGWFVVAILVSGNLAIPILLSTQESITVPILVLQLYTQGETARAAALFVALLALLLTALLLGQGLLWLLRRRLARRRSALVLAPTTGLQDGEEDTGAAETATGEQVPAVGPR